MRRSAGFIITACVLGFMLGCVKDVDFQQADEIVLSPDVQIDLLIYNVDESHFFEQETKEFKPVIRDTVRLEFLDDEYIQKDLTSVEFQFRHTNTFSGAFRNTIKFLSTSGSEQFRVEYEIAAGSENNPVETDYTELVENNRIEQVRNSIQMVVELEPLQADQKNFSGELDFASKGLFMFDF